MPKERILNEFYRLNCITHLVALNNYIDFCLAKNTKKILKKTSSHHILPAAKTLPFNKFKDLKEYAWNKTELSYHDHYIAHYLLTLAIDHISVHCAFSGMHNKDFKSGRLLETELICRDEYEKIYQKRNILISQYRKELIEVNGQLISRASSWYKKDDHKKSNLQTSLRMAGGGNIVHLPGIKLKMRQTKIARNMDSIGSINAANTMKKEFITQNGETTTKYKENGKKLSKTLTLEFTDANGVITTIAKERAKLHQQTQKIKGNWFILKNIFNSEFSQLISAVELRRISANLCSKTRDDYIGKSTFGESYLKLRRKDNLIGLYVEKQP